MPDAAIDATAEALTQRLLAEVPADRPRGAADIDRLPGPLVPLLHARLAAAVDAAAPTPSAWIDDEAIADVTATWRRTALDAARIPADAWSQAVRETVGLALAHLIWPADTLAAVAFAGAGPALPVDQALDRTRAFGPYPYLPQIAARYAARKELDRIDRIGLEQLFRRIDRRMVSTFGPDDWTTLLGPLLDLVGPVGSPPGAIATALLRPLFMTKGVGTLAVELEGVDSVSPNELRTILERTLVRADAPPQPQVSGPAHPVPPPAVVEAPAPNVERVPDDLPAPQEASPAKPPVAEPPAPQPPAAEGIRPPTIGSKYLAPEFDDHDESEVLGPPVPVGSSSPDEDAVEPDPADIHEADRLEPEPHEADETVEESPELKPLERDSAPDHGEADEAVAAGGDADAPPPKDPSRLDPEPDAMAEVREALADPLPEPPEDMPEPQADSPESSAEAEELTEERENETTDVALGSNPLIRPEPVDTPAPTIADSFVFPERRHRRRLPLSPSLCRPSRSLPRRRRAAGRSPRVRRRAPLEATRP